MNESEARKILGLKAKGNPRVSKSEFDDELQRKQAFIDNSPSPETKARYQKELDDFKEVFQLISAITQTTKGKRHQGLLIALLLISLLGGAAWWGNSEYVKRQSDETRREQQLQQQKINQQNLLKIAQFEKLGDVAVRKRKWNEAQRAFDSILKIDPQSASAKKGIALIQEGKLEERNQKIFYTLGNSQAALEGGQWDEAARLAQSVLNDNPGHKEALKKLQVIRGQRHAQEALIKVQFVTKALELGKLPEAQKSLDHLKKWAPDHRKIPELERQINAAMAEMLARKGKALALLRRAQKLDHGQFSEEAILLLSEAKQLDSDNTDITALHEKISNYTQTIHVPADMGTIAQALAVARPRDRILVAEGVYKESVTIEQVVRLEGSTDGKTILELSATESPLITITAEASGTHLSNLTLNHVGFDYDDDRSSALIFQGGKASIDSCVITNAAGHGIAVIDGAMVSITGCQITGSGWDGISVYGQGSHATIREVHCEKNLQHGIEFWKGGSGTVDNGKILANGLCGILAMSPGTQVSIKTTLCARNRAAGILISDQVAAQVIANRCDENLLSGIVARGVGTTVSIFNCVTTGNQEAGMLIHKGVKRVTFLKNKATKNKHRQIWLDAVVK